MMSLSNGQEPDDQFLVRYLVGSLADDETERLDELSITDDQFASHLSAVENDLVDAYVRGVLSGETLDRFKSRYLSSPTKREKIRFAETLLAYQRRAAAAPAPAAPVVRFWFTLPRLVPQWGLAGVAVLVLAAAGYLLVENLRLRNQMADVRTARAALEEREQQLQRELNDQRAVSARTATELASVREALAQLEERMAANERGGKTGVLSFMLLAARRGAGEITTIAIPTAADAVTLRLEVESVDFPHYRVALKDPATDQILWRSDRLKPPAVDEAKSLSITIPASLLKQQTYSLELTGIPARGAADVVTSYAFAVVVK